MEQQILDIILKDTFSLTQLKHRLRVLKSYLSQTFFGAAGENFTPPAQDSNWLKSLPQGFYQNFNQENMADIFFGLEKSTTGMPILTMYLTFEPDDATLDKLGLFTRKNLNLPSLLLDIRLDHRLIAGVALVWKGVYLDYSLRARIEEKRAEISAGFRRFLR